MATALSIFLSARRASWSFPQRADRNSPDRPAKNVVSKVWRTVALPVADRGPCQAWPDVREIVRPIIVVEIAMRRAIAGLREGRCRPYEQCHRHRGNQSPHGPSSHERIQTPSQPYARGQLLSIVRPE